MKDQCIILKLRSVIKRKMGDKRENQGEKKRMNDKVRGNKNKNAGDSNTGGPDSFNESV